MNLRLFVASTRTRSPIVDQYLRTVRLFIFRVQKKTGKDPKSQTHTTHLNLHFLQSAERFHSFQSISHLMILLLNHQELLDDPMQAVELMECLFRLNKLNDRGLRATHEWCYVVATLLLLFIVIFTAARHFGDMIYISISSVLTIGRLDTLEERRFSLSQAAEHRDKLLIIFGSRHEFFTAAAAHCTARADVWNFGYFGKICEVD
jgi:hypothetical protein